MGLARDMRQVRVMEPRVMVAGRWAEACRLALLRNCTWSREGRRANDELKQPVAVAPPPLLRHHIGCSTEREWRAEVDVQVRHRGCLW